MLKRLGRHLFWLLDIAFFVIMAFALTPRKDTPNRPRHVDPSTVEYLSVPHEVGHVLVAWQYPEMLALIIDTQPDINPEIGVGYAVIIAPTAKFTISGNWHLCVESVAGAVGEQVFARQRFVQVASPDRDMMLNAIGRLRWFQRHGFDIRPSWTLPETFDLNDDYWVERTCREEAQRILQGKTAEAKALMSALDKQPELWYTGIRRAIRNARP